MDSGRKNQTEFQKFASFYHQDFGLIFESAETGADEYLARLSEAEITILRSEIAQCISEYAGKDSKGLLNAWHRAGAQWWDSGKNLREFLSSVGKNNI